MGEQLPLIPELPALLDHPLWHCLAPFVSVEVYDRDGGHSHPRFRLELRRDTPADVRRAALAIECSCCRCGLPMHPFRTRRGGARAGQTYVAVTCPLTDRLGCARSKVAAETYVAIAAALGYTRER